MKRSLSLLFTAALALAQTTKNTSTQPAAKPKPKNSAVRPYVSVIPKTKEEERAENLAVIAQSVDRYKKTRMWLDEMTAKHQNGEGEDENHILGRHYAELMDEYEKSAIPIGERLIQDLQYFNDLQYFSNDTSLQSAFDLNTMIVNSQHLGLILAGLQAEDTKWLRNHAKDRIEPGIVIVK
jgi:hypothetical protein